MSGAKGKTKDGGEKPAERKHASENPAAFHITEADEAVLDGATAPKTLVQFLLATLSRALPLDNDQIKALLSTNRSYLSHILVKGVQGNFSALLEWFEALQGRLSDLQGAVTADADAACRMCSIFRSGLRSRSGALASLSLSLLDSVRGMLSQDEDGAAAVASWFRETEEGGSGVLVALAGCARMHRALRGKALAVGLKGVGDPSDLLFKVLPRRGTAPIKQVSMQVAWVEHIASDAAMRDRAQESGLPQQLLLSLVQRARHQGLEGAYHVALLDAISRVLALFPTATAFSAHGLGQAGEAFATASSIQDPGCLASVASTLCSTIECLVENEVPKESLPAFFRPCIWSFLASTATPGLRRHWCSLLYPLLERLPEAPVGALVGPYTSQLILHGYDEHDFRLLSALLRHPRCGVTEGEHIASFTAQVAVNDTVYGRAAAPPLIMAIVRFQQAPNVVAVVIALCRVALTILTDEHTARNRNKVAERCELAMEVLARIFVLGVPTVNLPCQRLIATARTRWVEVTQGGEHGTLRALHGMIKQSGAVKAAATSAPVLSSDLDPLVGGLHHLVKHKLYRKGSEPGRAAWSDKREKAMAATKGDNQAPGKARGKTHPALSDADQAVKAMPEETLAFRAATPTRLTRERESIMGPSPTAKATTVASREEEIQQYAEQRRKQREAAAEKKRRQQEAHDPPSELREQLMAHFFAVANAVKHREEQELLGSMLQSVSRVEDASEGEEDSMSEVFDNEWTPDERDGGILNLYQLLNKRAAVEMFKPWARPLRRAFRSYARAHDGNTQATFAELQEAHSTMNMSELLLFLKDFDLLPSHVSREEATRLFWRVTTAMGAIARGRRVPSIIRSKKKGEMSYIDLLACLRVIAMRASFPGPPHESGRATAMANIMRDACERANQRMLVKGGGECRQGPTHVWKAGSTREKLLQRWNGLLKDDPRALLPPGVEREVSKVYEAPNLLPEAHAAALEALDVVVHQATGGDVHLLVPRLVTRVEMSSFRDYMALENKPAPKFEKTVPQNTRLYPTPPPQRAGANADSDPSPKRVVFGKLYKLPESFANSGPTPSPQRRYRFGEGVIEGQAHARRPLARFVVGLLGGIVDGVESGEAKKGLLARHSVDEAKGDHISRWVPLPASSADAKPREPRAPKKLKEVMKQNEDGELEALRPRLTEMARPVPSRVQTKAEERRSQAEREREQQDLEGRKALKQRREELRKQLEAQKKEKEEKEKEKQAAIAEKKKKKQEREKVKEAEKAREREEKKAQIEKYREKRAKEEAEKKKEEAEAAKKARAEKRRMQALAKKRREAALQAVNAELDASLGASPDADADATSDAAPAGEGKEEEVPAADGAAPSAGADRQAPKEKRVLTEEERERRVRQRRTKLAAKARKKMAWQAEHIGMMSEDKLGHELRERTMAEEQRERTQRRLERYMARRQRKVKQMVIARRAKEKEERKQRAREARERARAGRGQAVGGVADLSYASDEDGAGEEWYGKLGDEEKDGPRTGLSSPDPEVDAEGEPWSDHDGESWTGEDTPRNGTELDEAFDGRGTPSVLAAGGGDSDGGGHPLGEGDSEEGELEDSKVSARSIDEDGGEVEADAGAEDGPAGDQADAGSDGEGEAEAGAEQPPAEEEGADADAEGGKEPSEDTPAASAAAPGDDPSEQDAS